MVRTIRNRFTNAVIWEGEAETVKDAIHAAIAAKANLSGANLSRANLSGAHLSRADLSWANLSGAHLSRANLSGADLSWANLSGAHLSRANLSGANLSRANLSGANLSRANLSGADLSGADLSGANLSRANLSGANLSGAHLSRANLSGADLSAPPMVLLAAWGEVSDELCSLLMRYDAANHPAGVAAFDTWAAGGACPYTGVKVGRSAIFTERKSAWNPNVPVLSAYELMVRVIREKCASSDYHEARR